MRLPRMPVTVRRLMVAILLCALASWLKFRVWNREYTATATYFSWPAVTVTYSRTYGDRFLERIGLGVSHPRIIGRVVDPPPQPRPFWTTDLSDLLAPPERTPSPLVVPDVP